MLKSEDKLCISKDILFESVEDTVNNDFPNSLLKDALNNEIASFLREYKLQFTMKHM